MHVPIGRAGREITRTVRLSCAVSLWAYCQRLNWHPAPNYCIYCLELTANPQLPPRLTHRSSTLTRSQSHLSVFSLRQHSYSDSDTSQVEVKTRTCCPSAAAVRCFLRQRLLGNGRLLENTADSQHENPGWYKYMQHTHTHTHTHNYTIYTKHIIHRGHSNKVNLMTIQNTSINKIWQAVRKTPIDC